MFDPSYLADSPLTSGYKQQADMQGYSATSAVNVTTTTGDIDFGTLGSNVPSGGIPPLQLIGGGLAGTAILPASVELTAFTGGIDVVSGGELFPSATGNLSLIADQSINLFNANGFTSLTTGLGMLDVDPSAMPSPVNQAAVFPSLLDTGVALHALEIRCMRTTRSPSVSTA